jgi:hypothetical protein
MKNYLIVVEGIGMNSVPSLTERFAHENPDYAKGVHRGLKMAYPKNEVYLEEIKN